MEWGVWVHHSTAYVWSVLYTRFDRRGHACPSRTTEHNRQRERPETQSRQPQQESKGWEGIRLGCDALVCHTAIASPSQAESLLRAVDLTQPWHDLCLQPPCSWLASATILQLETIEPPSPLRPFCPRRLSPFALPMLRGGSLSPCQCLCLLVCGRVGVGGGLVGV